MAASKLAVKWRISVAPCVICWFWLDFWLEEYGPKVDYVDSSHSQVENKHPKKDPVLVDFSDSTVGFVNVFGI